MEGLRCWRCGGGLWDRNLWGERERERGKMERGRGDVASVAAVIKQRAEGRAGSSASLMSVCSVCSVVSPCGPLLKRANDGWGQSSLCFCPLWRVNHMPVNSTTPQLLNMIFPHTDAHTQSLLGFYPALSILRFCGGFAPGVWMFHKWL